jgi:hypothetical protein
MHLVRAAWSFCNSASGTKCRDQWGWYINKKIYETIFSFFMEQFNSLFFLKSIVLSCSGAPRFNSSFPMFMHTRQQSLADQGFLYRWQVSSGTDIPIRFDREPEEFKFQFKILVQSVWTGIRPVRSVYWSGSIGYQLLNQKKRISGEFDVFSNLN